MIATTARREARVAPGVIRPHHTKRPVRAGRVPDGVSEPRRTRDHRGALVCRHLMKRLLALSLVACTSSQLAAPHPPPPGPPAMPPPVASPPPPAAQAFADTDPGYAVAGRAVDETRRRRKSEDVGGHRRLDVELPLRHAVSQRRFFRKGRIFVEKPVERYRGGRARDPVVVAGSRVSSTYGACATTRRAARLASTCSRRASSQTGSRPLCA